MDFDFGDDDEFGDAQTEDMNKKVGVQYRRQNWSLREISKAFWEIYWSFWISSTPSSSWTARRRCWKGAKSATSSRRSDSSMLKSSRYEIRRFILFPKTGMKRTRDVVSNTYQIRIKSQTHPSSSYIPLTFTYPPNTSKSKPINNKLRKWLEKIS